MTSKVIDLTRDVETAWEIYAAFARQLQDDQSLLTDRQFHQRMAKAYQTWRDLYLEAA